MEMQDVLLWGPQVNLLLPDASQRRGPRLKLLPTTQIPRGRGWDACVCLFACLPAFLLVCLSACLLFVCRRACVPVCLSVCLPFCLLACLTCLSFCLPVRLPACLFVSKFAFLPACRPACLWCVTADWWWAVSDVYVLGGPQGLSVCSYWFP